MYHCIYVIVEHQLYNLLISTMNFKSDALYKCNIKMADVSIVSVTLFQSFKYGIEKHYPHLTAFLFLPFHELRSLIGFHKIVTSLYFLRLELQYKT